MMIRCNICGNPSRSSSSSSSSSWTSVKDIYTSGVLFVAHVDSAWGDKAVVVNPTMAPSLPPTIKTVNGSRASQAAAVTSPMLTSMKSAHESVPFKHSVVRSYTGKSHLPRRHTWRKFSKFYWPLSGVGIPMEQPALRRTLSLFFITTHWHLIERTPGPYYLTADHAG